MAAPKGNQFWKLRSKHGCDKLFADADLMWEAACEYFEWCEKNPITDSRSFGQRKVQRPFTLQGLTSFLHCNTVYFAQFKLRIKDREDQASKDFAKVIQDIEDTIYRQKYENAAIGVFKENLISRDLGMTDKKELTGEGGGPIRQEVAVTLNLG
jgi:hypothetical protein